MLSELEDDELNRELRKGMDGIDLISKGRGASRGANPVDEISRIRVMLVNVYNVRSKVGKDGMRMNIYISLSISQHWRRIMKTKNEIYK